MASCIGTTNRTPPGCKPLSLLPGPQQFYGQWHMSTIRTFLSLGCWSSLAKIDNLTVREGRVLSATHRPWPSRCSGFHLHGRVNPPFPLLGDVAVVFSNSLFFLSDETLKIFSESRYLNEKNSFR